MHISDSHPTHALIPNPVCPNSALNDSNVQNFHAAVCAISKDGRIAAVGGKDVELYLWSTETGELLSTLKGHETAWTSSNDTATFVTLQEDSKASPSSLMHANTLSPSQLLQHAYCHTCVLLFLPHDSSSNPLFLLPAFYPITCSPMLSHAPHAAMQVFVWDTAQLRQRQLLGQPDEPLTSCSISLDDMYVVVGGARGSVYSWDMDR